MCQMLAMLGEHRQVGFGEHVDTAFGLVLIRDAILNGSTGLTYATLQSFYE